MKEGRQWCRAGFGAGAQDHRVTGAQRVGGLRDVVGQPADDRDLTAVVHEAGCPARLGREVGRDAVGADEVALDGRREPGHHDGDVAGSVDVADRHGDPSAPARHVERQQLARLAVALVEHLTNGAHRRSFATACW